MAGIFCFANLNPQNAESRVDSNLLAEIQKSGFVQNVFIDEKNVNLEFTPDSPLSKNAVVQWKNSENPRLTLEKLFYLEKTGGNQTIDAVSKIIRSISTMKGTEYYSNRHKKWEILYHDAYLIKSKTDRTPVADDVEGSADGKVLYCFQKDNSFGNCFYELNYRQSEDEISVCFENFEPLKFGPVTAAKAGNIKINFVILDEGGYFLAYMLVQSVYPKISFLEEKMIDSLNSRVDSIFKWFEAGIKSVQ